MTGHKMLLQQLLDMAPKGKGRKDKRKKLRDDAHASRFEMLICLKDATFTCITMTKLNEAPQLSPHPAALKMLLFRFII